MIVVNNKFEIGEIVYLVTDQEQRKRVVTGITICPDDSLLYEVITGTSPSKHYDFEISREEDVNMKVS